MSNRDVTDEEFKKMLDAVLAHVRPETIEKMRKGAGPDRSGLYVPSKSSARSKRWREGKAWAGNPYRVEVGQHWRRIRKADSAALVIRILEVGSTHAIVTSGLRTTRIRLDRFHPGYQGYRLLHLAEGSRRVG